MSPTGCMNLLCGLAVFLLPDSSILKILCLVYSRFLLCTCPDHLSHCSLNVSPNLSNWVVPDIVISNLSNLACPGHSQWKLLQLQLCHLQLSLPSFHQCHHLQTIHYSRSPYYLVDLLHDSCSYLSVTNHLWQLFPSFCCLLVSIFLHSYTSLYAVFTIVISILFGKSTAICPSTFLFLIPFPHHPCSLHIQVCSNH